MFGYIIVSVFKLLYKNPWCNINNCKHETQFIVLKILLMSYIYCIVCKEDWLKQFKLLRRLFCKLIVTHVSFNDYLIIFTWNNKLLRFVNHRMPVNLCMLNVNNIKIHEIDHIRITLIIWLFRYQMKGTQF